MIQVVLFDLGGVLVELSGVTTFRMWAGDRLTTEQIWQRWLSSPAVRAFETGRIDGETFAGQLIAEFELTLSSGEFLSAFTAWPRGLLPGAADLVQRVRQRCRCATLCNTNVLHWRRFVEEMELEQLFEHRFASHLIGKLKPDADVFDHVVASLNCAPSEILFIDDQPLNVEAARRLGLDARQATGVQEAERILVGAGVLP